MVALAGCGKHDDAQERLDRAIEQAGGIERAAPQGRVAAPSSRRSPAHAEALTGAEKEKRAQSFD